MIILSQRHLRRVLTRYGSYYHQSRTHLGLEKGAPTPRRVQVPTEGRVVAVRKSVDFIIGTSDAQPDAIRHIAIATAVPERRGSPHERTEHAPDHLSV